MFIRRVVIDRQLSASLALSRALSLSLCITHIRSRPARFFAAAPVSVTEVFIRHKAMLMLLTLRVVEHERILIRVGLAERLFHCAIHFP